MSRRILDYGFIKIGNLTLTVMDNIGTIAVTFYGLSGIMYLTLPDDSKQLDTVNADKHSLGSYFEVQNMIYLPRETKKWFIFPNWYPHFTADVKLKTGELQWEQITRCNINSNVINLNL